MKTLAGKESEGRDLTFDRQPPVPSYTYFRSHEIFAVPDGSMRRCRYLHSRLSPGYRLRRIDWRATFGPFSASRQRDRLHYASALKTSTSWNRPQRA
jgi:hypothetical protein